MAVSIVCGDLFASSAPALLLSTDLRVHRDALGGANLISAFRRRWPEAWEDVEAQLLSELERVPNMPLGAVVATTLEDDGCPFMMVLVSNSLPHLTGGKADAVTQAVASALEKARQLEVTAVVAPVMVGGWRLQAVPAFEAMLAGVREAARRHHPNPLGVDLEVRNQDQWLCETLAKRLR